MQDTPRPKRKRTNPVLLVLMGVIPVAAVGFVLYQMQIHKPLEENRNLNSGLVYNMVGLADPTPLRLNTKFADANGDLVADPPADANLVIDPPTILFSFVGTEDPERYQRDFKEFVQHISAKIGRPVEYVLFKTPEEELNAMCDGKLHVAGFNTGNVPLAVNQCGFVPVCNFGTGEGVSTYQMEIIVPADSPIRELKDLRGKELALTEPGSNSGFKAPLVLLYKDNGLQPGRDFTIRYSGGHEQSIAGIANKEYQVAAVASDILARALVAADEPPAGALASTPVSSPVSTPTDASSATAPASSAPSPAPSLAPRLRKDQYRTIYKSENFPTAGLGYVYNLKPELAAKVKDAFFSFVWVGTGVEREFGASKQTKFVPVTFKNDWALVRRIDDAIRSIKEVSPTTEPAGASSKPAAGPSTRPAANAAPVAHDALMAQR